MATKKKAETKKKTAPKKSAKKVKDAVLNASTSIEEQLGALVDMLDESIPDATKFDGGTKAAGARVRKALQTVKRGCQELRKTISEKKASI